MNLNFLARFAVSLSIQEFFDVLDIIQGIINDKFEIRNNPELAFDPNAQLMPDFLFLTVDAFKNFLFFARSEKAEKNPCNRHIGRNIYPRYRYQIATKMILGHYPENLAQILLQ
jgi:hypothetical protein